MNNFVFHTPTKVVFGKGMRNKKAALRLLRRRKKNKEGRRAGYAVYPPCGLLF